MKTILELAKEIVIDRLKKEQLLDKKVVLMAKVLSAEEAIGNPERDDFPLIKGKEKIIEANFEGHSGHAFTDMYGGFEGQLKDVFEMGLSNNYRRALLVATINALAKYWGLVENTVHCKDEQPEVCARRSVEFVKENYPKISRIAFVGYQPALIDAFSKSYVLKILDLDKDNVGKEKFGSIVLDGGEYMNDAIEWADIVLATGSTIINGTIEEILSADLEGKTTFYGVSISGAAQLLGLKRICFTQFRKV